MKRAARDGRRVKITHYGKTLAAVIPAQDLELLEECEQEREGAAERGKRATRR
jgi:antitoxin (DNA-binding transcriptional repressor) of toxin-antitoxin stability system